jgi:hypothetical protein
MCLEAHGCLSSTPLLAGRQLIRLWLDNLARSATYRYRIERALVIITVQPLSASAARLAARPASLSLCLRDGPTATTASPSSPLRPPRPPACHCPRARPGTLRWVVEALVTAPDSKRSRPFLESHLGRRRIARPSRPGPHPQARTRPTLNLPDTLAHAACLRADQLVHRSHAALQQTQPAPPQRPARPPAAVRCRHPRLDSHALAQAQTGE